MIKKLAVLILISTMLAGCLPSASPKNQQKSGQEFVKGAVVAGFPNLPLYPGAKVVETFKQDKKYGGSFMVRDDLVKVVNFYSKVLPEGGFESKLAQNSSSNYTFSISNSTTAGKIIVNTAADGKQTAITISIEGR